MRRLIGGLALVLVSFAARAEPTAVQKEVARRIELYRTAMQGAFRISPDAIQAATRLKRSSRSYSECLKTLPSKDLSKPCDAFLDALYVTNIYDQESLDQLQKLEGLTKDTQAWLNAIGDIEERQAAFKVLQPFLANLARVGPGVSEMLEAEMHFAVIEAYVACGRGNEDVTEKYLDCHLDVFTKSLLGKRFAKSMADFKANFEAYCDQMRQHALDGP